MSLYVIENALHVHIFDTNYTFNYIYETFNRKIWIVVAFSYQILGYNIHILVLEVAALCLGCFLQEFQRCSGLAAGQLYRLVLDPLTLWKKHELK